MSGKVSVLVLDEEGKILDHFAISSEVESSIRLSNAIRDAVEDEYEIEELLR